MSRIHTWSVASDIKSPSDDIIILELGSGWKGDPFFNQLICAAGTPGGPKHLKLVGSKSLTLVETGADKNCFLKSAKNIKNTKSD